MLRGAAPQAQLLGQIGRDGCELLLRDPRVGAEVFDGRLVDQPDPILVIDDDDALAQVLNDVIVELDEVAQVQAALLCQGFGFDDALAQELHDRGDHEDHGPEDAGGRVLCARGHSLQLPNVCSNKKYQRRDSGQQERALR